MSDYAEKTKQAAIARALRAAGIAPPNGNGHSCGSCPAPVAPCFNPRQMMRRPDPAFYLDPSCPSPMGGSDWGFKSPVGFGQDVGGVRGGFDQDTTEETAIVANGGAVAFDTGYFELSSSSEDIAKSRGMSIRLLTLMFFATGTGAGDFDEDIVFRTATLYVRQGGSDLAQIKAYKAKFTDLGLPGYRVVLNPVEAAFGATQFRIVGQTLSGEGNFTLTSQVTAGWGEYQPGLQL